MSYKEAVYTQLVNEWDSAEEEATHPLENSRAHNAEEKADERICIAEQSQGDQAGGWLWSDTSAAEFVGESAQ